MMGLDRRDRVRLDGSGNLVVAETDILAHDGVQTSVVKLEMSAATFGPTGTTLTLLIGLGRSRLSAMTSIFCKLRGVSHLQQEDGSVLTYRA